MEKFSADPQIRNYLCHKAYQETPQWKQRKKKYNKFILGGFLIPVALFILLFIFYGLRDTMGMAFVEAGLIALLVGVFCFPVAIISLKHRNRGGKIVSEDRVSDEVIFDKDRMIYSYVSPSDGCMHETVMSYAYIERLQYSEAARTLYLFGAYHTRITRDGRTVSEEKMSLNDGQFIIIPMYFAEADAMMQSLSQYTGVAIETIDKN